MEPVWAIRGSQDILRSPRDRTRTVASGRRCVPALASKRGIAARGPAAAPASRHRRVRTAPHGSRGRRYAAPEGEAGSEDADRSVGRMRTSSSSSATPPSLMLKETWGLGLGARGSRYCDVVVISSSFASSAENPHCSGSKSPHSSTAGFSVFDRGLRVGVGEGGRCSWVRRRSMS